jgi:hypothetical protein
MNEEEDEKLRSLYSLHKRNWNEIMLHFPNRKLKACQSRYSKKIKEGEKQKQAPWTAADEAMLKDAYVAKKGKWPGIMLSFPDRTKRACQGE